MENDARVACEQINRKVLEQIKLWTEKEASTKEFMGQWEDMQQVFAEMEVALVANMIVTTAGTGNSMRPLLIVTIDHVIGMVQYRVQSWEKHHRNEVGPKDMKDDPKDREKEVYEKHKELITQLGELRLE